MDATGASGALGFPTTHWTQIHQAVGFEQEAGARALADLLEIYRPALRKYLQHRFYLAGPEDIEDCISSFLEKKVIGQRVLEQAQKAKGKFRHFLCGVLCNFARDEWRKGAAQKRHPAGGTVPFDETLEQADAASASRVDPGDVQWAVQVIEEARARTETFCRLKARDAAWQIFYEACYLPLYRGEVRPTDAELALKNGVASAREAANLIVTVKRRFGRHLRDVVKDYVGSEREAEEEIRELIAIVSNSA